MPKLFKSLDRKKGKDPKLLAGFVGIFCRERHGECDRNEYPVRDERIRQVLYKRPPALCEDCRNLLDHGIAKLLLCPYDHKPRCKKYPAHCYAPGYRERIR